MTSPFEVWRGGPPLRGEPGSPEFIVSCNEAIEARRAPDKSRFRSLVVLYKASNDYRNLADSTRAQWAPWLDRIDEHFGNLRIAQFDRPRKIRPVIRRWRNTWADTPRTADYGMQVLSHAMDALGRIAGNPCEGIKQLYSADRSEIIWTDADIAELKSPLEPKEGCAAEITHAVDLAAHTGLRLGDLLRVSWSHVGEDAIVMTTGESRHRREVSGDHGLGGRTRGQDHQALCGTSGGDQGHHRTTQAGQRGNISCKTGCKTHTPEWG